MLNHDLLKCRGCYWWRCDDSSGQSGICEGNRLHQHKHGEVDVEASKRGAGVWKLRTPPVFGCIAWEAKRGGTDIRDGG